MQKNTLHLFLTALKLKTPTIFEKRFQIPNTSLSYFTKIFSMYITTLTTKNNYCQLYHRHCCTTTGYFSIHHHSESNDKSSKNIINKNLRRLHVCQHTLPFGYLAINSNGTGAVINTYEGCMLPYISVESRKQLEQFFIKLFF